MFTEFRRLPIIYLHIQGTLAPSLIRTYTLLLSQNLLNAYDLENSDDSSDDSDNFQCIDVTGYVKVKGAHNLISKPVLYFKS